MKRVSVVKQPWKSHNLNVFVFAELRAIKNDVSWDTLEFHEDLIEISTSLDSDRRPRNVWNLTRKLWTEF